MDDARPSDAATFEAAVAPLRGELHAYCYRMLGSLQDAEDAVQETLLGAWKGFAGFEGRSSLRTWLYRVATHACLRVAEARGAHRILPDAHGPAAAGTDLDPMVLEPVWLEPYPTPADAIMEARESVELAFVAALQHLPAIQRATLILSDVLDFSATEMAALLETTVPAANSALQRARESVAKRVPAMSQQAALQHLGDADERALVAAYVEAWGAASADRLVALLTQDAKFSMPPIPTWFAGREAVGRFFGERVFATPWRLVPMRASGQLAFACYQGPTFRLGALNVIAVREGRIAEITGFLDPAVHARFGLATA